MLKVKSEFLIHTLTAMVASGIFWPLLYLLLLFIFIEVLNINNWELIESLKYIFSFLAFILTFLVIFPLGFLFSFKEKKFFLVLFSLFLAGLYLPRIFISPNYEDYSPKEQIYIKKVLEEHYGSSNPWGVKIKEFSIITVGNCDRYSGRFEEYGFLGLRDGYYWVDGGEGDCMGGGASGAVISGKGKKLLPYFLLVVSISGYLAVKRFRSKLFRYMRIK